MMKVSVTSGAKGVTRFFSLSLREDDLEMRNFLFQNGLIFCVESVFKSAHFFISHMKESSALIAP
jgi:hypothetical protein